MNKLFTSILLQNLLKQNKPFCFIKPNESSSFLYLQRNYCSKYYSKKKILKPSVIPVSKGNAHLKIRLFDENDVEIGPMNMNEAQNTAIEKNLKLVLVNEEMSPPKFRLMKGSELVQEQLKKRDEIKALKANSHDSKEKDILLNLKVADYDLSYKIKSIQEFYDKGNKLKISIKTNVKGDNIALLQNELINKIKSQLNGIKHFEIKQQNEKFILIKIPSKIDEPVK